MSAGDAAMASRLRRMQRLATGLLALMAIVFMLTSLWRDDYPWLTPVMIFAEAALIGGLADWFAVTALFRRPLGLPIPHTAIVPNRKNEIGQSLARFIAEHFLVRDVLAREVGRIDPGRSLGRWLAANAGSVTADLSRALRFVLADQQTSPLREAVSRGTGDMLRSVPTRQLLAALIDVLATGPHANHLIDSLVGFGREQLDRNREQIRGRIDERSPWWLPRFVDDEIFDQLVAELERILGEVGDDANHPAREELTTRLQGIKDAIADDAELSARGDALRDEFLAHPGVREFGRDVANRTQAWLISSLDNPDSELRQALERELGAIGQRLDDDTELAARLNHWLSEMIVYLVETYRDPISSVISTTVADWEPAATSRRIELHIGRDLQFIRINGTLVGGLVGLLLWLSWTLTIE